MPRKIKESGPTDIAFEDFKGINDIDPPEKTKPNEVQAASNVEVDDTGRFRRRDGYASVYAGSVHSLWSDENICLFRQGQDLKRLSTAFAGTTIRSGLVAPNRMNYLSLNGWVYYSDEIVTGVYDGEADRSWGILRPPAPILEATVGSLQEGRYHCVLTYVRNDGQESGASQASSIDVPDGGGIVVTLGHSEDATISHLYVYLTPCNGETFYYAGAVSNGTGSFSYQGDTTEFSIKCLTLNLYPPPPGQNIQFYNGRIFVAQNNVLWYSEPYGYELFDLARSHFQFGSRITLLAPVQDGIWVGTYNQIDFLAGDDAHQLKYIKRLNYGAIEGTQKLLLEIGKEDNVVYSWLWASTNGVVIGTQGGTIKNVTQNKYSNPSGNRGASLLREEDDRSLFIVGVG